MSTISSLGAAAQTLAREGVAFAPEIARAAAKHGLDPRLLAAIAAQETGGPGSNAGRNILGDGGHGHGVFQIDDRWHGFARTAAAMNPQANADYAAGLISNLLKRYGGNVHKALSAYNAGSPDAAGTKTEWRDGRELGYADSVMRHYAALGGTTPAAMLADASAESRQEQSSVNALSSFAALQLPAPQLPAPSSDHAWRSMQKQTTDFASVIFSDGRSSE
jgi:hypothetical protein